jgi:hypothetical protein
MPRHAYVCRGGLKAALAPKGLTEQVFGPQSPDPVMEQCQIDDTEGQSRPQHSNPNLGTVKMNRLQYLAVTVGAAVAGEGVRFLGDAPNGAPFAICLLARIIITRLYANYLRIKDVGYLNPGPWAVFATIVPFISIPLLWERSGLMLERRTARAMAKMMAVEV